MSQKDDCVWSFGYGSNMDATSLMAKKQIKIVDHVCAVLKGWRLFFNLPGPSKVEPSFANIVKGEDGDEVHGVAFCMTRESGKELDRIEFIYHRENVTLHAYDGKVMDAFVYINPPGASISKDDIPPSARYLGLIVKGAKSSGLDPGYINRLSEHPVYTPNEETLAMRNALPDPKDLKVVTMAELAEHHAKSDEPWVSVLGYITDASGDIGALADSPWRSYLESHMGRDITAIAIKQYRGVAYMGEHDDRGKPPYPVTAQLEPDVLEYVRRWGDHYLAKTNGKVIGYLDEFLAEQK